MNGACRVRWRHQKSIQNQHAKGLKYYNSLTNNQACKGIAGALLPSHLLPARFCRIVGVMSPEIALANQVRFRMVRAEKAWQEGLDLLREAAVLPSYSGPDVQAVEQLAAAIAEILNQVQNWHLAEQVRRASRPRIATRGQRNAVKRAIAEVYHPRG